jgi:hypothetical protein
VDVRHLDLCLLFWVWWDKRGDLSLAGWDLFMQGLLVACVCSQSNHPVQLRLED